MNIQTFLDGLKAMQNLTHPDLMHAEAIAKHLPAEKLEPFFQELSEQDKAIGAQRAKMEAKVTRMEQLNMDMEKVLMHAEIQEKEGAEHEQDIVAAEQNLTSQS